MLSIYQLLFIRSAKECQQFLSENNAGENNESYDDVLMDTMKKLASTIGRSDIGDTDSLPPALYYIVHAMAALNKFADLHTEKEIADAAKEILNELKIELDETTMTLFMNELVPEIEMNKKY